MRALRVKAPGKSLSIRSSLMSRASPLSVCPNHGPHREPDSLIVPSVRLPLIAQVTGGCSTFSALYLELAMPWLHHPRGFCEAWVSTSGLSPSKHDSQNHHQRRRRVAPHSDKPTYAFGTKKRIAQNVSAATTAEAGIVSTQAQTICFATPQRTADRRVVDPTPMIAPVMVCVVLTGIP
jgi:hypothetical protein